MDKGVLWGVGLCILLVGYGVEVKASHHHPYRKLQSLPTDQEQPYRTAYHFQPLENWMNDPNGPVYYKGVYHLFYQYNPHAAVAFYISWGHSVSYNLVDWIQLEPALNPSEPYDSNGCWSGSITILPGEIPAILYTGINLENRQVQNLAVPKNLSDPLLREWVKSSYNPLMTPVNGIDPEQDLTPLFEMNLPSTCSRQVSMVMTTTFWEITRPKQNFLVDTDFLDGGFDFRYDYGKFYASKTFFDSAKKRRILWAWVSESDTTLNAIRRGWAGIQAFPRSVLLSRTGQQLVQWPIKELEKLRANKVAFNDMELKGGSVFEVSGITASQADVEVSFDLPNLNETEFIDPNWVDPLVLCPKGASLTGKGGPFGLLALASRDLTEQTAVFFRIFRKQDKYLVLMCSDQSRSSLGDGTDRTTYGVFINLDPRERKISLRSLIDHSVIENFGADGRACITARVYPTLAIHKEAHLYVFNNGTQSVRISSLNAWSMKRAQIVPSEKNGK
ncbi:hypothetical protein CIPAW_15G037800 [Carya illinoinensis]|uniref:Uncharacterized protein n=1 Tax=Carya illinoinensis TaxID=32201 RepID=A0A8T1N423_CARIL|nr:hypothetical protein CIPAW_15G037800 [Carya illinoinensis]